MENKTRAPNFTINEVETLIDLLYSRPDLVNGKIGKNYKSYLELTLEWEYITEIVNGVGTGYKRSTKDVKKKWKDLKFQAKKKANKVRAYRNATGSDPPAQERLTDLERKIVCLINLSQADNVEFDIVNQTTLSSENSDNEMSENPGDPMEIKIESVKSIENHLNRNNSEVSLRQIDGTARIQAHRDRGRKKREEEENDVMKELIQLNSQVLKYLEKSNDIKHNMLQEMKLSNKLKIAELKIKCKVYNLDLGMINAE